MKVFTVNNKLEFINHGLFAEMEKSPLYSLKIFPLSSFPPQMQYYSLRYELIKAKPDIIFTPGWSVGLFDLENYFRNISRSKAFHVYWSTEDPIFFDDVSMVFAPRSDYTFTTDSGCVELYLQRGIKASTLMFACNNRLFKKVSKTKEYEHDIVLVANNYYWFDEGKKFRQKSVQDVLLPLLDKSFDIKIWGADWVHPEKGYKIDPGQYGGILSFLETPKVYSSAKIVLGLQSVNTSPTHTSTRTFEVMGSGNFFLTAYTPAHENLFRNHYHLVWSKSPEETLELVKFYLKNPEKREAIARRGQEEVLSKHTYHHRLREFTARIKPRIKKGFYLSSGRRF